MLIEVIGKPAMLEQTAEEATELAFACLKLARLYRGENEVYGRTEDELINNICEEFADIFVCLYELERSVIRDNQLIETYISAKKKRMKRRLMESMLKRSSNKDTEKDEEPEEKPLTWKAIWTEEADSHKARCSYCGQLSDYPLGYFCKWCGTRVKELDEKPFYDLRWIRIGDAKKCPHCGMIHKFAWSPFCPNCGSHMIEDKDDE